MDYQGDIIEESLADTSVLGHVKILSTEVESVTPRHQTPWLRTWTIHTVSIPENKAKEIATLLSVILEPAHAWYADFRNNTHHFIIFHNKVFFIDRKERAQYVAAREYGLSLGIPGYQVDFEKDVV